MKFKEKTTHGSRSPVERLDDKNDISREGSLFPLNKIRVFDKFIRYAWRTYTVCQINVPIERDGLRGGSAIF